MKAYKEKAVRVEPVRGAGRGGAAAQALRCPQRVRRL